MSWLLDVNLILASRWTTPPDHLAAKSWIDSVAEFHTCALTELGFLRISLSTAYQATWEQAQEALQKIHARPAYTDDSAGYTTHRVGVEPLPLLPRGRRGPGRGGPYLLDFPSP